MGWIQDLVDNNPMTELLPFGIGSGVTSRKNREMQREEFEYSKKLQQQIFAREDNATQRRAEDLKLAGLSPVLAAGSPAGAGSVVQTSAPQSESQEIDVAAMLSMMQMKTQIAKTNAEMELMDEQQKESRVRQQNINSSTLRNYWDAAIKGHDYSIFRKSGIASNASTLGKIIRDAVGMSKSGIVQQMMKNLRIYPNTVDAKTGGKPIPRRRRQK